MRPLTHLCFLLLPLENLFCLHCLYSLELALLYCKLHFFFPCSRFGLPLTRQGAGLANLGSLSPHDLFIWTNGSVPFSFDKGGSGVLANSSFCGTETTFYFSAGPVCSSFSAEACAILQALRWSRQHQQVYHFSSRSLRLSLFSCRSALSTSFSLSSNPLADLHSLSSCTLGLQWIPEHSFLPGNSATDELARRGALLVPWISVPGHLL